MSVHMTGKQLWEAVEALDEQKCELFRKASSDELRRALGYGMGKGNYSTTAGNRAQIRRVLTVRGAEIPEALKGGSNGPRHS